MYKLSPMYAAVEKGMELKGEQNHDASTGVAAVDKKVCLATVNSKEIKPVALVIIKLHFSEGIS